MKRVVIAAVVCAIASASQAQPKLSRAVQQGFDHGFVTCAPALDQMVKFVNENDDDYAYLGVWSVKDPDKSAFDTVTSTKDVSGNVITTFSAVPNRAGSCDVTFTMIVNSIERTCAQLRDTTFKDWKFYDDMAGPAVYEISNDIGEDVILSPIPSGGCLIVRHYVGYGPRTDQK